VIDLVVGIDHAEDLTVMAVGLVLSGGAPVLTFMAGALVALDERNVKFDVISTSGMLVGLLYAAPKRRTGDIKRDRAAALKNTVNMGVSDEIYDLLPVNFKVFYKPGLLADLYRQWLADVYRQWLRLFTPLRFADPRVQRYVTDLWALAFANLSPSSLNLSSLGLCAHAPWVEEFVDFERLKDFDGDFFINAYNLTRNKMEIFPKEKITADHFRAALAFPFIYPPYELNGNFYIEGSVIDPLNFEGLVQHTRLGDQEQHAVLVFDMMGAKKLMTRKPRDLYDAWVQSIMVPLAEISKDDLEVFRLKYQPKIKNMDLVHISLTEHVPKNHWPFVLDWSYSNLASLYKFGYQAGAECLTDKNRKLLTAAKSKARPSAH
jgi:predicted acylesterase/phospholipase RssA